MTSSVQAVLRARLAIFLKPAVAALRSTVAEDFSALGKMNCGSKAGEAMLPYERAENIVKCVRAKNVSNINETLRVCLCIYRNLYVATLHIFN